MQFYIEVLDTETQIAIKILKAIASDFNDAILGNVDKIRNSIALKVVDFLKNTETYESLINGDLAAHFGLPIHKRQEMVDNILEKIGKNLHVEFNKIKVVNRDFSGELKIGVLIKNYIDILNMSEAFVNYKTKNDEYVQLPWLDWLLLQGGKMLVSDHHIRFLIGKGRSGMALMIKKNATSWRVPIEYQGDMVSNWLTRSFRNNESEYSSIIIDSVKEVLP